MRYYGVINPGSSEKADLIIFAEGEFKNRRDAEKKFAPIAEEAQINRFQIITLNRNDVIKGNRIFRGKDVIKC